jgi:hypothetical protein
MSLTAAANRREWFLNRIKNAINETDGFEVKHVYTPNKWVTGAQTGASGTPVPMAFVALGNERVVPAGEARVRGMAECDFWIQINFEIDPDTGNEGTLDAEANRIICNLLEPRLRKIQTGSHEFPAELNRIETVTILSVRAVENRAGFHDDSGKGTIQCRGIIEYYSVMVNP